MNDAPNNQKPARRGWNWPMLIVSLLGLQIVLCVIAVYLAVSDPTMAIEPDYYKKAVHWDQSAAEQRESDALGWSHELTVDPSQDTIGRREMTVLIRDADGEPLSGAVVEIEAFANARATQRFNLTLVEQSPGQYTGLLPVRHTGLWEFTLIATYDRETYMQTDRIDLPSLSQ
ncbi:FixH family protein [Planctomycetales bacterium ZRK34]|nr:FixH family protein [Planctomycetales bacterium ZRK34]